MPGHLNRDVCVDHGVVTARSAGGLLTLDPPPRPVARPGLLARVRETIRARHYSPRTEKAYVLWVKRFVLFNGKRHPDTMGRAEVSAFLSALATRGRVSASTQNQALSALLFLYKDVLGRDLPWLTEVVRARRSRSFCPGKRSGASSIDSVARPGSWPRCYTAPGSACSSAAACA